MSLRRLHQKGRIEPASTNPSPKPVKLTPKPSSPDPPNLQYQHVDQTNAGLPILLSSPKRLLQNLCPSTTRDADVVRSNVAGQLRRGTKSSSRIAISVHTQENDPKLEPRPAKRPTSNRQVQRPKVESAGDTTRARRRARQQSQPVCTTEDAQKLLFACPFHKLDPDRYRDCRRFELSRVKDVKQHLQRKHSPPSYCNRCYTVFGNKESLADHQRGDNPCERRDGPLPGSISEQQWQQLNQQYQSRGKPVEEQWKDFWRILFPGRDEPRSVYLDTEVEETVSRMLAFWSIKKMDIATRIFRETGISDGHLGLFVPLFDKIVEGFLRQFEVETATSLGGAAASSDVKEPDGFPSVPNPTRGNTPTVAPMVVENLYFNTEPEMNHDHLLTVELRPPPDWGIADPEPFPHRTSSASVSTNSLPDYFGSEQPRYGLMDGESDQTYWTNQSQCDETSVQIDPMLDDSMMLDSQPTTQRYRYTWPLPGTETRYRDPGELERAWALNNLYMK